ncbi:uncharacterized protein LOC100313557 [Saccoglossus kowalevskii]|uniref:ASPM-like protein n=1 Tax=Saccoglossus kowalevskii TaxID=10224 RepID=A0ABM0MRB7_SACKO|nr:PREDICTED: ASPM-like protein [Saccoglossus kowalevskii]
MAAAVSPSFNGLSSPNTPKQKRGSWFSRTPHRKSPPVDEDIPVLKLAFFSGKTIISFGKVKVNRSKSCKLRLVNPADLDVQLVVERFPSQKGFTISEDRWVLESQEEQIVSIRWSPTEAGNVRELVTFKFDNAHRLQVIMVGTSVASPVKKTKKRSKWNVKKSVISELRSTKLKKQCKQLLKDGKKHRSPNVSRFDEENIHPNEAAITNEKTSPLGMLITPMPTTPSSIRRSRTFEKLPNPSFLNASIDSQSDFRLPLNNSALNISISPNRSDINPMLPSQPLVAEEDSRLTFCIGQNASSVAPPVEPLSDLCNLISYQGDVDHSLAYSDIHGTSLNTSILVSEAELLANHTADILGSFLIESPTQPSRRKCSSTPLTDAKKGFLHAMQCEEDSKAEIPRKELFKEPQMLPMKRKPKSTTVNAPLDTETTNKPARKNSVSSGASSANSRKNHTGAIPKKKFSATATKPSTIRVTQSTDAKTTNSFDSKRLVNRITKSDVPRRGVITTGKPKTESFAMPPRITKRLSSVSGTITHPSGEHIPLSTSILEPNEEKRKPENLTRKLVSAPIVPLQPLGESQMLSSSVAMEPDDQSLISDACTVLDQSRRLLSVSAMITEPSGESKLMSQSMDQGPCVKNLSPISAFLPEPLPLTCPLTTESEQVVSTSINSLSKSAFITGPFDESISRMTAEPRRLLSGTITKPSGETRLLSTSITETPKESTTVTLDTRHLSSASATITKPCGESKVLSTTITKEPQEVISRSGQATKQLFLTPREPCNETQTHFPGPPVIVETENRSRRLIQAQIVTTEPCGKLTLTPRKSSTRSSAENNVPSVDLRRLSSASATITKPCGEFRIVSKTESQKAANGQSFTNENLQHVEENDESMLTPMGDLDYSQINNTIDSCLDTYSRTSQKRTTQGKQQEPKRARVESYRDKLNDKKCSKPPTAGKKRLGSTSSVKGLAMSKLSLQKSRSKSISSRPMMYASQNMYYDEKWMKKQELGFTRWLNFILTPDELDCPKDPSCKMNRVDAGKILCMDTKDITLAPTKEELSLKSYTATRRLNRLRRSACMLFESESIVRVVHKIEEEIESLRLLVRADKHINKDYGVRQQLLNMILCYNPLWLRIGLETIYGVVLNLKSNTDVHGLSTFIVTRLLNNPMIASDYSHPTVPNLFKDGYEEALAKFTLKKFLLLVLFLDRAKLTKLIDHDPCLFCKDAEFKSSRNLLLIFSRDFLSGEGDVTRHLGYLGYTITATQTSLDEFDYAVSNIAVDLRCGIRLTRIMGLLTHNWKLLSQLRTPAISRLQKIHNVGVCLKAMKEVGIDIESGGLSSKDIIDGHREKTLELLWRLVFHFQISINLNENQIQEEVTFLKKNLRTRRQLQLLLLNETHVVSDEKRLSEPGLYYKSHKLSLLLEWSKAVCAYYNLKVENFTVSFSDGRVLCCLVHHYHPSLLPWNGIRHDTTQSQFQIEETESDGEEFRNSTWCDTFSPTTGKPTQLDELLTNEKHNFKMVYDAVGHLGGVPVMIKSSEMSHTIPNEKVFIVFRTLHRSTRLLSRQHRAARLIQSVFRMHRLRTKYQKMRSSAIVLQAAFKSHLSHKKFQTLKKSAIKIQQKWKATLLARRQKKSYLKLKGTVILAQSLYRARLARIYVQRIQAAVKIQSAYRGYVAFKNYKDFRKAVITIQSNVKMSIQRRKYKQILKSTKIIQEHYRAHSRRIEAMKKYQEIKTSCVTIQTYCRRYQARKTYRELRRVTIQMQALVRRKQAMKKYKKTKQAALVVQALREAEKARLMQFSAAVYLHMCAIKIQRAYRNARTRKLAKQQLNSIITLQRCFRKKIERRQQEKRLRSVTVIQSYVRMYLAKKYADKRRQSITLLQAMWRGRLLRSQLKSKKIIRIRRNLTAANLKAKEEDKLSNRTTSALDYLKKIKQMSDLLSALEHLEVATRLSAVCCERMATNNGIQTIYELLNGFNRSLPHMQAISRSISILVNLAKYEATVSAVYYVRDKINSINIIMEQIQNFREKGCSIFTKACLLLSILGQHEHIREEILAMPKFTDKIKSLYTLTMRKRKRNVEFERMKSLNSSMFNSFMVAPSYNLNVKPAWNLSTNRMKETEDSLEAIKSVARVFQIQI